MEGGPEEGGSLKKRSAQGLGLVAVGQNRHRRDSVGARGGSAATAVSDRGRGTRGGLTDRRTDTRKTPPGPKPYAAAGCRAPVAAAVR